MQDGTLRQCLLATITAATYSYDWEPPDGQTKRQTHGLMYLRVFSADSVGASLLSVLSGRPFVAAGLDRESFAEGLLRVLGEPGPFTVLTDINTRGRQTDKC